MPSRSTSCSDARAFLAAHLGRDAGVVEVVGEGEWSRCFGFRVGERDLVIRFGDHLDDFEKDRRAASFCSHALPIPDVTDIGEAFDGYFAISTRAYGEPLESLDAGEWVATLPAVFGALDGLRSADVSETLGYGGWDARGKASHATWREFLLAVDRDEPDRRTHGWRRRLIESPVGDGPFRAGIGRLSELAEAFPPERYVVHADLLNRNVLVASGRLSAIFDWGCSFYGDFLYDIALLEFWTPWYPALAAIDIRDEARKHYASIGLHVEDLDARIRCCLLHIGLDHQAYAAWTGQVGDLTAITERTLAILD